MSATEQKRQYSHLDIDMDIQQTVKTLRHVVGLTQAAIAKEIGCSQPTVNTLEHEGAVRPSYKVVSGLQRLREQHAASFEQESASA